MFGGRGSDIGSGAGRFLDAFYNGGGGDCGCCCGGDGDHIGDLVET